MRVSQCSGYSRSSGAKKSHMPLSPVPHVLEFDVAHVKILQRVLPNGVEEVPQGRLARRVEMGLWEEIDACCLPRDNGGGHQRRILIKHDFGAFWITIKVEFAHQMRIANAVHVVNDFQYQIDTLAKT